MLFEEMKIQEFEMRLKKDKEHKRLTINLFLKYLNSYFNLRIENYFQDENKNILIEMIDIKEYYKWLYHNWTYYQTSRKAPSLSYGDIRLLNFPLKLLTYFNIYCIVWIQ